MDEPEQTQKTDPKGIDPETGKPYKPVEIPVPTRDAFLRDLEKVAPPAKTPQE